MKFKYNNELFDKISEEKKSRILEAAITEFADYGYDRANINKIAEKAGVSVGSIYKYFNNKQDLYLAIVNFSVEKLKTVLNEIISSEIDFLSTVEKIIKAIQLFSRSDVYLTKLYNEMATENNSELVWKIASDMEGISANLYSSIIKKAQDDGQVRKDINSDYFAFFLDNLFILLQFSYSCEYYKERLKMFIDEKVFDNDDLLAEELLKFIKGAFYLK
ncbi:TetR/AcrR family transcriptional regulator [Oceanirhabdus seepicola]|uniref:TetR/AcrR family transcriptional regulator n=1 Tax=Oceanirhabdus seepicola TaxID=2828781 RepID=A0A9J6P1Z7_9CLOT|nr:TetR/AcrR family transcriptional regulator [Oceanirhabdus seepicola]MCM1990214.1 TetR/AcrR family transcriptional regulator [Oceanirhabdus seepicola]